jgi:hypothetical protein
MEGGEDRREEKKEDCPKGRLNGAGLAGRWKGGSG